MWDIKKGSASNNLSVTDCAGQSNDEKGNKFAEKVDTDSGFLSGQISSSEQFPSDEDLRKSVPTINPPPTQNEKTTTELDSGIIEDDDNMLLESPADEKIYQYFSNMKIQDSNNFNRDQTIKQFQTSWEMYYQQNEEGDTQLHISIIHELKDVIMALIRVAPHPCLYDIQNDISQTALHLAVLTSQPKIVRKLILAGAKLNIRDYSGNTALHLACLNGESECARELLTPLSAAEQQQFSAKNQSKFPQDLEQWNYNGEKCVHLAAKNSRTTILQYLIKAGADINAREGKSGLTALHLSIEQCNEEVANILLDCPKLSLETVTYAGLTAYQLAAIHQNQILLSDLLKKGAEPLTPPESEDESDAEDDQIAQYYGTNKVFTTFNGPSTIHVA